MVCIMAIPFTQYLRPDGRRRSVEIERPEDIERKALQIIQAGYVFECEHLTTGHASFTIADPVKGEDVAIEVVPSGPAVPDAVDRLVTAFDPERRAGQ